MITPSKLHHVYYADVLAKYIAQQTNPLGLPEVHLPFATWVFHQVH